MLRLRHAVTERGSAVMLYVALGLCVGVWSGSLHTVGDHYLLSATAVAWVMVAFRLAGIVTMQCVGRAIDQRSALVVALGGLVAVASSWVAAGLVPLTNLPMGVFVAVAIVAGSALGALDVATNAHAAIVDSRSHTPILGVLHACFSLGALVGSALILVGSLTATSLIMGRALVFCIVAAAAGWAWYDLRRIRHAPTAATTTHTPQNRSLWAIWPLVAMAVCVGLSEGAAFDWSTRHVTDTQTVPASAAALGLMCVTVAMIASRALSDLCVARWGRARFGQSAALVGAAGYALTVWPPMWWCVLLGWVLVGAGAGTLAPQIYGAAGQTTGGRGMAIVVSGGYTGILLGPVLLGPAVDTWGTQTAMIIPLAFVLTLVWLCRWLPNRVVVIKR